MESHERFMYCVTYDHEIATITQNSLQYIVSRAAELWNSDVFCDSSVLVRPRPFTQYTHQKKPSANLYTAGGSCGKEAFRVAFRVGNFLTVSGNGNNLTMDDFDQASNIYIPVTMSPNDIYPYVLRRIGEMVGYSARVPPENNHSPCIMCPLHIWRSRPGRVFSEYERTELRVKAPKYRKTPLFGGKQNIPCKCVNDERLIPPGVIPVAGRKWERVLHRLAHRAQFGGTRNAANNVYNRRACVEVSPKKLNDVYKVVSFFKGTLLLKRRKGMCDNTVVIALPAAGKCVEIYDRANMFARTDIALHFKNDTFIGLEPEFSEHRVMYSLPSLHYPSALEVLIPSLARPSSSAGSVRAICASDTIKLPQSFPSYNPNADVKFKSAGQEMASYVAAISTAKVCNGHRVKYMFSWRGIMYAVDENDNVHDDCVTMKNKDGRPLWMFVQLYVCSPAMILNSRAVGSVQHVAVSGSDASAASVASADTAVQSSSSSSSVGGGGSSIVNANDVATVDIQHQEQEDDDVDYDDERNSEQNGQAAHDDEKSLTQPFQVSALIGLAVIGVMVSTVLCNANIRAHDPSTDNKRYKPNA